MTAKRKRSSGALEIFFSVAWWNEHFDNLLNVECVQTEFCSPNFNQECIAPLSMIEVEEAVQKLNNKAPVPDLISPEFIKNSRPDGLKAIHNILTSVWEKEILPEEWKHSTCGFRKGRSTTDQIFFIRQNLEETREFGIGTHHLFVDFKTAYDSVNRKRLIEAMREFNIPDKLVRLTTLTLCKTMQKVKIQNDFSEPMEVKNGVRQGDALACLLFKLALEKIIRDSGINTRGHIFHKSVQIFAFADGIDIIARTQSDLKQAFLSMQKDAEKMHLTINQEKTKYMQCTKITDSTTHLQIGEYKFEKVNSFVYLGSEVNVNGNIAPEIQRRINSASKCFYGLKKYLKSNLLKRDTKLLIYKCLIRPILTYASETWTTTQKDENSLGIFERRILRSIFGGKQVDGTWYRRSNSELYRALREPDVVKYVKIQRIKWAGHIIRMNRERPTNIIFSAQPIGSRPRGRPKLRWADCVERDFSVLKVSNWKTTARQRQAWRKLIEKARAHPGLSCH
ncbi:uncharacterized protein [Parasteatoda tepidariorum]|uniref:uncharacterized protein n=1 Tax=Parasteatoda tepidariorum TaxID=114398 RepID=UPI0039BD2ED3